MTKEEQVLLAQVWATCDHFEQKTKRPVLARILKDTTGVSREQLRRFVKKGRLDLYYEISKDGQRQMAFLRPKERGDILANQYGENSRGRKALGEG